MSGVPSRAWYAAASTLLITINYSVLLAFHRTTCNHYNAMHVHLRGQPNPELWNMVGDKILGILCQLVQGGLLPVESALERQHVLEPGPAVLAT